MDMVKALQLTVSISFLILLAGCLYPQERLGKNSIPYDDQLTAVQVAVDQFREDNGGILPIQTKDNHTPIYQKYPIDFGKLVPKYMQEPPGTSFENGGTYQYVLIDPETDPTVKLIDLILVEHIREVALRLKLYREKHTYPPFGSELAKGRYAINYEELGYKEPPYVVSPFSGENLPLFLDNNGEIFIDYSIDLYHAIQTAKIKPKSGEDIRSLLADDSPFVPAFSLPYTVNEQGEPIFIEPQ